jgi:hypothetical protein
MRFIWYPCCDALQVLCLGPDSKRLLPVLIGVNPRRVIEEALTPQVLEPAVVVQVVENVALRDERIRRNLPQQPAGLSQVRTTLDLGNATQCCRKSRAVALKQTKQELLERDPLPLELVVDLSRVFVVVPVGLPVEVQHTPSIEQWSAAIKIERLRNDRDVAALSDGATAGQANRRLSLGCRW